jgi:hypothetical protein
MTVGADQSQPVDVEGLSPSGTGFYIALAAWIPLVLFLLAVATPPQTHSGDCGLWGCPTNNLGTEVFLLVPGTPVILVLAAWAKRRAARVLELFPDSMEAGTASTAHWVARLAAVGTTAAWAWVLHY